MVKITAGSITRLVTFTLHPLRGETADQFDARVDREKVIAQHRANQLS